MQLISSTRHCGHIHLKTQVEWHVAQENYQPNHRYGPSRMPATENRRLFWLKLKMVPSSYLISLQKLPALNNWWKYFYWYCGFLFSLINLLREFMSLSILSVNRSPNKKTKYSFKDYYYIINLSIYETLSRNYWISFSQLPMFSTA